MKIFYSFVMDFREAIAKKCPRKANKGSSKEEQNTGAVAA